MKWITIPAPITPRTIDNKPFVSTDENGEKSDIGEVSMHRYLLTYIVNEVNIVKDERTGQLAAELKIGRGYEGNKRTGKIDRLFSKAAPGTAVGVEDEDYKVVKKIIEEKAWPSATFGAQFCDFEEAWMSASDKKPEIVIPEANHNGASRLEA